MSLDERIALVVSQTERTRAEIAAHRAVWCREPITRTPINEQALRHAAAAAAFNDSKQDLGKMIT